jgi:hypothetical protein
MRSILPLALALALLGSGCAVYDAPPEPSIAGLNEGLLPDPRAPIAVTFSKPPVQSSVTLEIAKYVLDSDAELAMPLQSYFTHDPVNGDTGGVSTFSSDGLTMTITPTVPLPAGGQLVVVVEPGLADTTGAVTRDPRQLIFGYAPATTCDAPVLGFRSGTYFFLTNVDEPISVQLALYVVVSLDPATGMLQGQSTKAWRNRDVTRCTPACPSSDVCRTLPGPPACVTPSTPADSVDEFPDYAPNPDPPTGFSFAVNGCTVDVSTTTTTFSTNPVDVSVQSPMVTLRNAALSASFVTNGSGVLQGTGQLVADAVLLGTIDSGMGHGNLTALSLTAAQTPSGLPQPSASP